MNKYKILLVTALSKPWNNGWYYKAGFEANGHEVITFDPSSINDPKKEIFKLVKEKNPDLIIHTKNELPSEIFQKLREYATVVQWYPDLSVTEELYKYVMASDIFFTMAEGLVAELRKYNQNVFWLSQAFEPSFFKISDISPEDQDIYSTDVTFVGSLGSKSYYLKRRGYLKRVVDSGVKFKWWGPKMPRKFSTLPMLVGKLGRSYGGGFVYKQDYAKVAQLSKIFLAFDAIPSLRKSMSARMYTAVGCGAFYMCEHVEGIEEVLMPDRDIVTFRSEDEMIDKIRYYLNNDSERRTIANAGQNHVLNNHTYTERTRQLLELIKNI